MNKVTCKELKEAMIYIHPRTDLEATNMSYHICE